MEKVLHKLFWAPTPFKRHQNTSRCGTVHGVHFEDIADIMLSRRNFVYLINKIKMFCLDK